MTSESLLRGAAALAWMAAGAACGVDLTVDPTTRITCGEQNDCPPGWICQQGRCVTVEDVDDVPPALVSPTMPVPDIGKRDDVFTLDFEVTETLSEDPAVRIDVGGVNAAFILESKDGLSYRYTYTAAGSEAQGRASPITITLTDENGLVADNISGGVIEFDFRIPTGAIVSGPTPAHVSDRTAPPGTSALTMTFDEPLSTMVDPAVSMSRPMTTAVPWMATRISDQEFTFEYTARAMDAEGDWTLSLTAEDEAGNVLDDAALATIEIDRTAPTLVSQMIDPPPTSGEVLVRRGAPVTASLTFSETPAPGLSLEDTGSTLTFAAGSSADTLATFLHVVNEPDATYPIEVFGLRDLAGNPAAGAIPLFDLVVETDGPVVTMFSTPSPSLVGTDTLSVTFSFNEAVQPNPVVRIGPEELNYVTGMGSGPFDYALDLSTTMLIGPYQISVQATDLFGNFGATPDAGFVTIDAAAPQILGAFFSPSEAPAGAKVLLHITTDEFLGTVSGMRDDEPLVVFNWLLAMPTPPFAFVRRTDFTYTWEFTVPPMAASTIAYSLVSVELEDEVGNRAPFALNPAPGFTADGEDPSIISVTATPDTVSVNGPNVVTVTAIFDDPAPLTPADVRVELDGSEMTGCSFTGTGPYTVSCMRTISSGDPMDTGTKFAAVSVTDPAGNVATGSDTIVYDFSPPEVVSSSYLLFADPQANLAFPVEVWGDGTELEVPFSLDEDANVSVLAVSARCGATVLPMMQKSANNPSFSYHLTLSVALPTTSCDVEAFVEDQFGNNATRTVLTVPVDQSAPVGAVDVTTLKYLHIPWGADASGGLPRSFVIPNTRTATEDPLLVIPDTFTTGSENIRELRIYSSNAPTAPRLASFVLDGMQANWLPAGFAPSSDEVWMSGVDHGGNESARARIDEVEWVVTLGNKLAGSTLENPNLMADLPAAPENVLLPRRFREIDSSEGIAQAGDGGFVDTVGPVSNWFQLNVGHPTGINCADMVYDVSRGQIVQFGGATWGDCFTGSDETWIHDGVRWTQAVVLDPEFDGAPDPRRYHAMAFDSRRGVTVLFAGRGLTSPPWRNDTWEYDGISWHRRCDGIPATDTCSVQPADRMGHSMAFDAKRGVTVMHGGNQQDVGMSDTWEWDGNDWSHVCGPFTACTGLNLTEAGMVYDQTNEVILLQGGKPVFGAPVNTLYSWDGTSWTPVCGDGTACAGPGWLSGVSLSYDTDADVTYMFGGTGTNSASMPVTHNAELWRWDGTSWTLVCNGTTCNSPVFLFTSGRYHSMAYHGAVDQLVLLGESLGAGLDAETWTWTNSFQRAGRVTSTGIPAPPYVLDFQMAYDWRKSAVHAAGGDPLETWRWDGGVWEPWSTTGLPSDLGDFAFFYFSNRLETTLFGGTDSGGFEQDELYATHDNISFGTFNIECSGAGPCVNPRPTGRYQPAMADLGNNALMFGGHDPLGVESSETWYWNGTEWVEKCTSSCTPPPTRKHPLMAYHVADQQVYMVGGTTGLATVLEDTWIWDSATENWALGCSGPGCVPVPVRQLNASLAYDSDRQRLILMADVNGLNLTEYTWNGSAWAAITPHPMSNVTPPTLMRGGRMVYDTTLNRLTMHKDSETWVRYGGTGLHSAQVFQVPTVLAGLPATSAVTYQSVSVRWDGAGESCCRSRSVRLYHQTSTGVSGTFDTTLTPLNPMSDLAGVVADGPWTLEYRRFSGSNSGTIDRWCIDAEGLFGAPVCDETDINLPGTGMSRVETTIILPGTLAAVQPPNHIDVLVDLTLTGPNEFRLRLGTDSRIEPGFALEGWRRGVWAPLDTAYYRLGSEGSLVWTETDPVEIEALHAGLLDTVSFRAKSLDTNGTSGATVRSDYVEVRFNYLLP